MSKRAVLISALILAIATPVAIVTVDDPVAGMLQSRADGNRNVVSPMMSAIEVAFGFPLSKFATGFLLVLVSAALFPFARRRGLAWLMLFVGGTHLTTRLVAGVLKNVFSRLRPADALVDGSWRDQFFIDGGSSFPSGHAAHFWSLFFALPKLRIPALVLAAAVSLARIAVNDHYVSDVLASAAIAAVIAGAYAAVILPRVIRAETPTV